MRKSIYVAYTGGTIGMAKSSDGYKPVTGYLEQLMASMPEFKNSIMPRYEIHEYEPLIDSSNMSPKWWLHIARDIAANYAAFDGFVVLHGTDTMAYTASALPFMLQGLAKPVILTGSQIPLCELRSDARENLITAMLIAARFAIPEVCLFFGNRLLRGNRSVKVNAIGFNAFSSPNYPDLGTAGINIDIHWKNVLPAPEQKHDVQVKAITESRVAALRLFPGMAAQVVENILSDPIKGLVLETYGVGNGPSNNKDLIYVLEQAVKRGVVVINCSQCLQGIVDMDSYATGSALARAGVINGYDMTTEAALAKTFYLFSRNFDGEQVKRKISENLRGELTLPVTDSKFHTL
ncbi:MAG: asparaginase [Desulfobacteraceae bacterium]|nr:asparaginase [Desulfobacteraceae bacterium]